jgi:hypothetical protein
VRRLGEHSSPAFGAKTVREFGVRMGFDIGFELIPIAIVVANFLQAAQIGSSPLTFYGGQRLLNEFLRSSRI